MTHRHRDCPSRKANRGSGEKKKQRIGSGTRYIQYLSFDRGRLSMQRPQLGRYPSGDRPANTPHALAMHAALGMPLSRLAYHGPSSRVRCYTAAITLIRGPCEKGTSYEQPPASWDRQLGPDGSQICGGRPWAVCRVNISLRVCFRGTGRSPIRPGPLHSIDGDGVSERPVACSCGLPTYFYDLEEPVREAASCGEEFTLVARF